MEGEALEIEEKRNELLPKHQKMQKRSQELQSLQDKKRNFLKEEVLDECKVEDSNREAYKGAPLEWRRVRRSNKYRIRTWEEDCWARIFALFREYKLQRLQSMHEDSTDEEEMKRQQRMNVMKDMTKVIISKGRMDAGVAGGQIARKLGSIQE